MDFFIKNFGGGYPTPLQGGSLNYKLSAVVSAVAVAVLSLLASKGFSDFKL